MVITLTLGIGYIYVSVKDKGDLLEEFSKVDEYISAQKYLKANNIISDLIKKIPDRYNCYKLLKRAIIIGEKTGKYELFLEVARTSAEKYSANQDLQAFYVMALLKNDKFSQAYEVASSNLTSNEFKPLLAQTVLYNDKSRSKSIVEYVRERRDPSFYEYLAVTLNDASLLINSALLWAESGEIEKAYNLLKDYDREDIKECIALLAYDSGRDSESLVRLLDLPLSDSIKNYNTLLIADLFYVKENWSRSKYYYQSALDSNRENSAPYINLSSIYKINDNFKEASNILKGGIEHFKKLVKIHFDDIESLGYSLDEEKDSVERNITKRLITKRKNELENYRKSYRELVLMYYSINKDTLTDEAVKVLKEYKSLFKDDVRVELLIMKNQNRITSPEIFEAKLWKLLNKESDSKDVSEYIVWYLLGVGNYNDAELVLSRSENRYPHDKWTYYYRGIISGIQGDYTGALEYFNSEELDINGWKLMYNKAVVLMAMRKYPEALTSFNKSLIILNSDNLINNKNFYRSEIKTKIAQVLIHLNDIDEAIRVLNSAIELNPDNYKSDLLKSIHLNIKERE